MAAMRTGFVISLLLFLLSCTPPARFYLDPGEDVPGRMLRLGTYLQEEGFSRQEYREQADYLLEVVKVDWNQSCKPGPGALLLEREFYVPLLKLPAYREDLSLEEIRMNSSIILYNFNPASAAGFFPEGCLGYTVEGKTIADSDYPLQRLFYLKISGKNGLDTSRLESLLAGLLPPLQEPGQVSWLGAVGDMMLQRGVEKSFYASCGGLEDIFNDTLPVLRELDILCGNLEGAVTTGGQKHPKAYNFRFQPRVLEYLKQAGFDYLSLTNNHSFDYGQVGFTDTLANLAASGVLTSGVGMNLQEALQPAYLEKEGRRVAIYSFGAYPRENNGFDGLLETAATATRPGVLWASSENLATLTALLEPGITNVAIVHGGYEWESRPREEYLRLYRGLIERGFQVVFASHPHVLQGMEVHGRGVIFYSLGNFIFPGMEEMPFAQESMIAAVGLYAGRPLYLRLTPVELKSRRIFLAPGGGILKRFLGLPLDRASG